MNFKEYIIKEGILDDITKQIDSMGSTVKTDPDVKTDKKELETPEKYVFKYDIDELKNFSNVKGIETDLNKSIAYGDMIKNPEYFKKNKGKKLDLIFISPEDYLRKTAKGFKTTYEENLKNINIDLAREYAEKMIDGVVFPTPYMDFSLKTFLQEGRHRAYAAMLLGKKEIPVMIITKIRSL